MFFSRFFSIDYKEDFNWKEYYCNWQKDFLQTTNTKLYCCQNGITGSLFEEVFENYNWEMDKEVFY